MQNYIGKIRNNTQILILYYCSVTILYACSFFPELRLWGFNDWAFQTPLIKNLFFTIFMVLPFLILFFKDTNEASFENTNKNKYQIKTIITGIAVLLLFAISFVIFRAKTFFMGDGYLILSIMSSENPLMHSREIGEFLVHQFVINLTGTGEEAALFSFQLISILSGILFIIGSFICSIKLFHSIEKRFLFTIGMSVGGYALLFFGYVEFYSLFVLSVLLYTITGLLISKGLINKWMIIPVQVLTIFFHIMGVTLLPGTIFILLMNSKLSAQSKKIKLLMALLLSVILIFMFSYFYSNFYFFRFSFMPFVNDKFTVEGYSLFSFKHIVDYINLLFILFPPLLFFIFLFKNNFSVHFKKAEIKFLIITIVSAFGAAFIFNPKLGMPRDWDLFSYAGIPLSLLFYYSFLEFKFKKHIPVSTIYFVIALSVLSLIPRVYTQNQPDMAIKKLDNLIELDVKKNNPVFTTLFKYISNSGDDNNIRKYQQKWFELYPEMELLKTALEFKTSRQYYKSISIYKNVIELNPMLAGAYMNIGDCFLYLQNIDSAMYYLNIANGMNPNNATTLHNMAVANLNKGNVEKAENIWLKALKLDDTTAVYFFGIAGLYKQINDQDKRFYYLDKASQLKNCPYYVYSELGEYYLLRRDYIKAAYNLKLALERGLDKRYINSVLKEYPQMEIYLR